MVTVHDETPGADGHEFFKRSLDPVLGFHPVKGDVHRDVVAGGDADQVADLCLIGCFGKMHGDTPAPVGSFVRGNGGLALKKALGQEIDDAPRGLCAADREGRAAGAGGEGGHQGFGKSMRSEMRCPSNPLPGNRVAQHSCLSIVSRHPPARPASLRTTSSMLSHAKNPVRKMRCGRVFTACEPETQGLFTALCTETYPGFSHACCHVFHEPADRVVTAC